MNQVPCPSGSTTPNLRAVYHNDRVSDKDIRRKTSTSSTDRPGILSEKINLGGFWDGEKINLGGVWDGEKINLGGWKN